MSLQKKQQCNKSEVWSHIDLFNFEVCFLIVYIIEILNIDDVVILSP